MSSAGRASHASPRRMGSYASSDSGTSTRVAKQGPAWVDCIHCSQRTRSSDIVRHMQTKHNILMYTTDYYRCKHILENGERCLAWRRDPTTVGKKGNNRDANGHTISRSSKARELSHKHAEDKSAWAQQPRNNREMATVFPQKKFLRLASLYPDILGDPVAHDKPTGKKMYQRKLEKEREIQQRAALSPAPLPLQGRWVAPQEHEQGQGGVGTIHGWDGTPITQPPPYGGQVDAPMYDEAPQAPMQQDEAFPFPESWAKQSTTPMFEHSAQALRQQDIALQFPNPWDERLNPPLYGQPTQAEIRQEMAAPFPDLLSEQFNPLQFERPAQAPMQQDMAPPFPDPWNEQPNPLLYGRPAQAEMQQDTALPFPDLLAEQFDASLYEQATQAPIQQNPVIDPFEFVLPLDDLTIDSALLQAPAPYVPQTSNLLNDANVDPALFLRNGLPQYEQPVPAQGTQVGGYPPHVPPVPLPKADPQYESFDTDLSAEAAYDSGIREVAEPSKRVNGREREEARWRSSG